MVALSPVPTDSQVVSNANRDCYEIENTPTHPKRKGMVLPFQHLSLTFNHVNYYVDMPAEIHKEGTNGNRLQLLCDVSGALKPGVMTALVGVTGAGKTTLLDVLAGRKTAGYLEGSINISGYPKNQQTFARISGYCEQNDIHSPFVTVYESLTYSAWLRLGPEVDLETKMMFVEEIMELVELKFLRDALVGTPGLDGLSTEQRKRLTIAVELVANPSIIFMDEPTSGLDARSAAIVMRTVRNTVNTGRTVVCTIHQPSIDIFEAFDELLLMKMGGQVTYAGELGHNSHKLVDYFEAIPGVPKLKEGSNPATWMLEITSPSIEALLNINFAEIFYGSSVYKENQEQIKELSDPSPGSNELSFSTVYAQSFNIQFMASFWKQHWSYWRNTQFNLTRFLVTIVWGILLGTVFWNDAKTISKQEDLLSIIGCIYTAFCFVGGYNVIAVQSVVAAERTVFYRERAAGMYSSLAYALSQVSIEIMYTVLQSLILASILYTMLGFGPGADKFLWFFFFTLMCLVYFSLFGVMTVSITPHYQIAGILTAFCFNLWNLFTGFILPRPLIPVWCRWYSWATPMFWSIYGVVISQVGDRDVLVEVPGGPSMMLKDFLSKVLGYENDFLGYAAAVHVGFCLLFFSVFVYSIKSLNFQNR